MFQWVRVVCVAVLVTVVALGCGKPTPDTAPAEVQTPPQTPVDTPPVQTPPANDQGAKETIESPDAAEPAAAIPVSDTQNFAGTVGDDMSFRMTLRHEGARLVGSYSYDKDKIDIPVAGAMSDETGFWFNEAAEKDKITGTFDGKFLENNSASGTWTSADKTKTLPFKMELVKP